MRQTPFWGRDREEFLLRCRKEQFAETLGKSILITPSNKPVDWKNREFRKAAMVLRPKKLLSTFYQDFDDLYSKWW